MGKKYIIELEEEPFIQHFKNGAWETIYRVKGFNSLVFDWNGLQMLTPYTEPDLEQVRKEAYDKCMDEAEMSAYKLYSPKIDEAYQRGLSDAWEAARKIADIPYGEEEKVLGSDGWTFIVEHSASEAIEKIRQYEREKEEPKESEEEQSVTVEEVMRQYLDTFCVYAGGCIGCPLHTPDFTCGRGYHFFTNKPVSDEEVRRAYAEVLQKMKEEA